MKNSITLVALIFAFSFAAFSQNARIEGQVFHKDSSISLPGVSVYLAGTTKGTSTNASGKFIISDVDPGNYSLVVSFIGYKTIKRNIFLEDGEVKTINFNLVESINSLPEVSVMTYGTSGLKKISGSAQYLSPKELEKFTYTDVNRVLRAVPGVNIQEEDGFGLRPNIGLRGTGVDRSSKITIMEDGVLMAPAPYSAPAAYYFPTIGRAQGVEVVKGSSQIKYGPYTTGGAINILSTQIPDEFSGKLTLLGGSFDGRTVHANVGDSYKNFAYMVETFQQSSEGFKNLDNGGNTGFNKEDYLAKFRFNTNETAKIYQSITFKIGQATENSDDTYLGLTAQDFESDPFRRYAGSQVDNMATQQQQYAITHVAKFSKRFHISTTAYRTEFKRNWYKLDRVKDSTGERHSIANLLDDPTDVDDAFDIVKGQSSVNDDALEVKANNREYYSQGVQSVLSYDFTEKEFTHNIDLGIRYHIDEADRFQWVDKYAMDNGIMQLTDAGRPGTESNRIESAKAFSTYLQYKLNYKKWTATPGVRYENIYQDRLDYGNSDPERLGTSLSERDNTVEVIIPGVSLDYELTPYVSTFAGVHKGFSPAGSQEETNPEESINYELGSRFAKGPLSGQAVLFFNDYSNLLGSDLAASVGGGTGELFNGGEAQTYGAELQFTYDLLYKREKSKFSLPLTVSYTYTNAEFQNDFDSNFEAWGTVAVGDELPYLANNQLTFILSLEHAKFSINFNGRYMDKMRTMPGQGDIPTNEATDDYFVLDLSASYLLQRNTTLFASVTNINDEVYMVARRPAGLRPGMPRALNLGIKARF